MEVQTIACVWVTAFVCLPLISDKEGQSLNMLSYKPSSSFTAKCEAYWYWNRSIQPKKKIQRAARYPAHTLWPMKNISLTKKKKKTKRNTGKEEWVCKREEVHLKRRANTGERSWAQWLRHREVRPLQIPSFLISSSRWKNSGRQDYAGQLRFLPKPWLDRLLREP